MDRFRKDADAIVKASIEAVLPDAAVVLGRCLIC